jgi:hypothetical protein
VPIELLDDDKGKHDVVLVEADDAVGVGKEDTSVEYVRPIPHVCELP